MKTINAAIVGCGAIGPVHAAAISAAGHAGLYAVCDVIPDRAERLASKYGCKYYNNFEQVLSDAEVQSVHICTPHYLHAEMAIKAAEAGKNIVLEKPVAMNMGQARVIYGAVQKAGVKCCAVLQNRLNPCVQEALEVVKNGAVGRMLGIKGFLTWQRTREYYNSEAWRGKWATEGGGLLINQAVHMLDLMYYLGGGIDAVKANIDTRVLGDTIEVEDTADATLYYKDGKIGLFYATNCYSANSPFFIEMHFEYGILRYMDNQLTLIGDGGPQLLAYDSAQTPGKPYWGVGHARLIDNFYRNMAEGGKDYTDLEDAAGSMGLLSAVYKSARSGKKETVELY